MRRAVSLSRVTAQAQKATRPWAGWKPGRSGMDRRRTVVAISVAWHTRVRAASGMVAGRSWRRAAVRVRSLSTIVKTMASAGRAAMIGRRPKTVRPTP